MTETPEIDSDQAFLDRAVVIALGSNLPGAYASSRDLLDAALTALDNYGLEVVRASSWWRSKAWPEGSGPDFLNGVVLVNTKRPPDEVLRTLQTIEKVFGRERSQANGPRTLDLDLVAHGRSMIRHANITIPHPRAAERHFVIGPLSAIAPNWVHPANGRTAQSLCEHTAIGVDAVVIP